MCAVYVVGVADVVVVGVVQDIKQAAVNEALHRGSMFVDKLGCVAPASLCQRLKVAATNNIKHNGKYAKADSYKIKEVADAKRFMPQGVVGCTIQLIPSRKTWTAYYPNAIPASRSRTWGSKFSKLEVLKSVLNWAWAEHTKVCGESCPHNLDFLCM